MSLNQQLTLARIIFVLSVVFCLAVALSGCSRPQPPGADLWVMVPK